MTYLFCHMIKKGNICCTDNFFIYHIYYTFVVGHFSINETMESKIFIDVKS